MIDRRLTFIFGGLRFWFLHQFLGRCTSCFSGNVFTWTASCLATGLFQHAGEVKTCWVSFSTKMAQHTCHLSVIYGFTDTRNTCHRPLCAILVLQKNVSFWLFLFFRIDGIRINFYQGHQSVTPYSLMYFPMRSNALKKESLVQSWDK